KLLREFTSKDDRTLRQRRKSQRRRDQRIDPDNQISKAIALMVEYLIKSSLILAVLWVFYKLFLEKESFFAANRVYLVACIVLTFLLPFVSLPQLIDDQGFISVIIETADNPASLTSDSQRLLQTPPDITAPDNEPAQTKMQIVDWLLWLYYFGVGIFAINFFIQVEIGRAHV